MAWSGSCRRTLLAVALAALTLSGVTTGCQSGDSVTPAVNVDAEFATEALGDGVVTRAELDQAYTRFAGCLRENGARGGLWVQPDYGRTVPALDLSKRGGPGDRRGIALILTRCNDAYLGVVEQTYAQAHPTTAAQGKQMLELALGCLRSRVPALGRSVPAAADYAGLRRWATPLTRDSSSGRVVEACVTYLGLPFRSLDSL